MSDSWASLFIRFHLDGKTNNASCLDSFQVKAENAKKTSSALIL